MSSARSALLAGAGAQISPKSAAAQVPQSPLWEGQLKGEWPSPGLSTPPLPTFPAELCLFRGAQGNPLQGSPTAWAAGHGDPLAILEQSPARSAPS